jgi:hypothetical protein
MENLLRNRSKLAALALMLTGCAAAGGPQTGPQTGSQSGAQSGFHLSPTECRDLAAIRSNAPRTRAQQQSELSALRKAGYNPSPWNDDPNFPEDLHAAQRLVDHWFKTECQPLPPGSPG